MSLQPKKEMLWRPQVLKNQVKSMLPSTSPHFSPSKDTKKASETAFLKLAVKDASFFLYEIRQNP